MDSLHLSICRSVSPHETFDTSPVKVVLFFQEEEEKGVGQVSVELADAQLFAVGGYHGRMTDTYFYFTTHTVGVGHRSGDDF